jgi:hypothetical protein
MFAYGILSAMRTPVIKKLIWLTFYSLPLIAFAANFTEPRAAVVSPQARETIDQRPRVVIHRVQRRQLASVRTISPGTFVLRSARSSTQEVKAYVQYQASELGVDPKLALWIVRHESQFNPLAKGDGDSSRGLWQISKIYHPEVSDADAFSVTSSTAWSLNRIRSGKANEWSTYRYCRTLYKDCPFQGTE